jgi:hypothetical protein
MNLVDFDNEIYLWKYYPYNAPIYKFGDNNTYLLQQKFSRYSGICGTRPIF